MTDLFGSAELLPALSMWQPYASLLFAWDKERGQHAKAYETRGFVLPARLVGKPVVIHATARFAPESAITPPLNDICYDHFGCAYNYSLPRGAVLGVVTFEAAIPTSLARAHQHEDEIACGDWSDGRWAWPVIHTELLPEPVPAKGRQGWWRYADPRQALSTQDQALS